MTDLNVIALGREAGRLLRDPAFQAGVRRAERMIFDEWAATHASEISRREQLHADWRALKRLEGALQAITTDGTVQVDAQRRIRI